MASSRGRDIEFELLTKGGLSEPDIDPAVSRIDVDYIAERFWIPTRRSVQKLRTAVARAELVHVHAYFSNMTVLALDVAASLGRPAVLSPRGCLHADAIGHASSFLKNSFLAFKGQAQLGAVRAFHYQSEAEAVGSIRGRRTTEPLVRVINNGVVIPESTESLESVRGRLFGEPECVNLVFLGRIHKIKGISLQVEALSILAAQGVAGRLHLVGPDDGHLQEVLERAAALGIAGNIEVQGAIFGQEKFDWMRAADAVLMSSEYENNSNVVLEVLACRGVLVATSNCVDESLGREGAALVTERDAAHLASAILTLATNEALALSIREKAALIADQRYSWASRAAEMISFYDECLA